MIIANKDSLQDVALLTAILMDDYVRSGSIVGVDSPKMPTVSELLEDAYVCLFEDGFVAFRRYPGPYSTESHLCFLRAPEGGRKHSVLECCSQALFWLFTNTPVERVLASAYITRAELSILGKRLGFRVAATTDTHIVYSLDFDDWAMACGELGDVQWDERFSVLTGGMDRHVARLVGAILKCGEAGYGCKAVKAYNRNAFCIDRDTPPALMQNLNPLTVQFGDSMLSVEVKVPREGG